MIKARVREKRWDILAGFVALAIITPFIVGFTYMLIMDADVFATQNQIPYRILLSLFIIGSKDALMMLFILITKFFYPYRIEFNKQGFYDCKLRQFVEWDKIDRIEYVDYKKSFYKKSNLIEYIIYLFFAKCTIGVVFELMRIYLFSALSVSKRVIIVTKNKSELLQKAGIFKKLESLMLPNNVISVNLEQSFASQEDIAMAIKAVKVYNKTAV